MIGSSMPTRLQNAVFIEVRRSVRRIILCLGSLRHFGLLRRGGTMQEGGLEVFPTGIARQ
jgi:hypothetical protein